MNTFLIFAAVLGTVLCEEDTSLRFYIRSLENYIDLPLESCLSIFSTNWYDSSKETVIFSHGFTGGPHGPAVKAMINAYLEKENYNVVLLNWQYLASERNQNLAGSYINWAAPNARQLGIRFAYALEELLKSGLHLNSTHCIGHSLGAQIFGIAGNTLAAKGIHLPWITGLDPASLGFENRPNRLHAGSAKFVDILHSDPSKYGYKKSHGTVDFWPNYNMRGPVKQPGCDQANHPMFSVQDLCNHNRCWQLWIDTLRHPGSIIGSYAKNYRTWKGYSENQRNVNVLELGKFGSNAIPGDYFFVTAESSPYGLKNKGL